MAQLFEIKFWDIAIPIMEERGPIMKIVQTYSQVTHSKAGMFLKLILIWSAVGFVFGILLGKILWIFQFL